MTNLEIRRQELQKEYDATHSQLERNIKGQFATPHELALSITKDALGRLDGVKNALEPSCGTGSFVSCLRECSPSTTVVGIEKDPAVYEIVKELWKDDKTTLLNCDFFDALDGIGPFDLLVTNPPYSRHHHLAAKEKKYYGDVAEQLTGKHLSQLAGLHAYFILAGTSLLRENGIASWLIPSELFSVNYGKTIRDYITSRVCVERVHFFDNDDLQFDDALVSSCVLVVRKKKAEDSTKVEITLGDFEYPSKAASVTVGQLKKMNKWQHFFKMEYTETKQTVGDYFKVKRGLSTGAESYYAKQRNEWDDLGIEEKWLIPVLPAPRNMTEDTVFADRSGWPLNSDRALLNIPLTIPESQLTDAVVAYLQSCPEKIRTSYTATHRKRWYSIEQREPAPIVCTYMSRSDEQPFRFIRNKSNAVVTTAYLCLYPLDDLSEEQLDAACKQLNLIKPSVLISSGREYGGGLRKLEPKELLSVPFCIGENGE